MKRSLQTNDLCLYYPLTIPSLRHSPLHNIRYGIVDWIDAAQHKSIYKRCDVKYGDLLLTKDGANTGNAALNNLDEEFSLLSSVAFLRLDSKRAVAGYFLQQILSTFGQRQIKEAMSGNAITRLILEKIKKLRFPVPSFPEQTAIAKVLSDTDSLISSLDELIAKKRDIKQATMQQLLTGRTRLPGFSGELMPGYKQTEVGMIPQDWKIEKLGDCLLGAPQYGVNAPAVQYTDSLPKYIRITDITEDGSFSTENIASVKYAGVDRYILKAGDLVFARTGASVGKTYLCKPEDGNLVFAGYLLTSR